MSKILIVDGNSLINRAYFAIPALSNKKGMPTNAVYGFINMLMKLISDHKPNYVSVAFDLKGPTFRHVEYSDYKGNRKGMDDDLRVQFPMIKDLLDAFGIHRTELQGYEADDLIGTIARVCEEKGLEVIIVTGDKDALQLSSELTTIMLTKKGITTIKLYTPKDVFEEYGLQPCQIPDYKGLSGDASDNIKGLPGIGPKTAVKLLEEFYSVESIIENAEQISNARIRSIVQENSDLAALSKRLATIEVNVPVDFEMDEFLITDQDHVKLIELLNYFELKTLMKHVNMEEPQKVETSSQVSLFDNDFSNSGIGDVALPDEKNTLERRLEFVDFKDVEILERSLGEIQDATRLGSKIVFDKSDLRNDKIIGIGISSENFDVYFDFTSPESDGLKKETVDRIYGSKAVFMGNDLKNDLLALMINDAKLPENIFDIQVGQYLLDPERTKYNIEDMSVEYDIGFRPLSDEDVVGKGAKKIKFSKVSPVDLSKYALSRSQACLILGRKVENNLIENNLLKLFNEVEIPLVEILASIEYKGFSVNTDVLDELDVEISAKLGDMTNEIYSYSGIEFNINSPKQLGDVLFETLDLPKQKKTKTGYSTNVDVLEKLKDVHPIIPLIMEYRTYSKLKSTYIDGLRMVINPTTGKIHTSLNQTVAATGRLSSSEPNLQNIPVRIPLGRRLRKVFEASEGNILVDADYSQIELRILAELSGDEIMINGFKNSMDIHTITASQVFDIPLDKVTDVERGRAKAVNFGIVYGMSDFGLSEALGIPVKTAKVYIQHYFEKYPKIKGFLDGCVEFCKKEGYVTTILGRKRYVHDINNSNFNLRGFAKRIAMNTPVQGSAADIMKLAMIKTYREMKSKNLKSSLILQVHDELIVDAFVDELDEVKEILKRSMENALDGFVEFGVPLSSSMNTGQNWYDSK